MAPSTDFVEKGRFLEELFCREVNGIPRGTNVVQGLTAKFCESSALDPIIAKTFVRQRVFIRMKFEAQKLKTIAVEKKLKDLVKLEKTVV